MRPPTHTITSSQSPPRGPALASRHPVTAAATSAVNALYNPLLRAAANTALWDLMMADAKHVDLPSMAWPTRSISAPRCGAAPIAARTSRPRWRVASPPRTPPRPASRDFAPRALRWRAHRFMAAPIFEQGAVIGVFDRATVDRGDRQGRDGGSSAGRGRFRPHGRSLSRWTRFQGDARGDRLFYEDHDAYLPTSSIWAVRRRKSTPSAATAPRLRSIASKPGHTRRTRGLSGTGQVAGRSRQADSGFLGAAQYSRREMGLVARMRTPRPSRQSKLERDLMIVGAPRSCVVILIAPGSAHALLGPVARVTDGVRCCPRQLRRQVPTRH